MGWIKLSVQQPDRGIIVMTKIDDAEGERNVQAMKYGVKNNMWWLIDDSMYVYYVPTHWRPLTATERSTEANRLLRQANNSNANSERLTELARSLLNG